MADKERSLPSERSSEKREEYETEHGKKRPGVERTVSRNEAGFGATDGLQTEASFAEAHEFLEEGPTEGDDEDDNGEFRVRTGWTKKSRYTGKFNDA